MINVVMLVKDRPKLTKQAIETLYKNTYHTFMLTVVDDGSQEETLEVLRQSFFSHAERTNYILSSADPDLGHITAKLRNYGVELSKRTHGRGTWLYLADNDSYFTPKWDKVLIDAYNDYRPERFLVIGGSNHPFHQPTGGGGLIYGNRPHELREYLTLAGTSQLMKWSTWDRFGPLVENGTPGACQGEDHEFCQVIRKEGGKVGAIWPEVVYDCGITQTGGRPSPGADVKRKYEGVIYE